MPHQYVSPLILKNSILFSNNNYGFQAGIGKTKIRIEKHRIKRSGKEKIIAKNQILWGSLGFYNHPNIHLNLFATAEYSFNKSYRRGWYREITPCIGLSRTFLTNTTYVVNQIGEVSIKRGAGDWRLASGFTLGFGKNMKPDQALGLTQVFLKLNTQLFYPNYRFFAVKPSLLIGFNMNLNSKKYAYTTKIKTVNRWHHQKK